MGNFKIHFGLFGANHTVMCTRSFKLSCVFIEDRHVPVNSYWTAFLLFIAPI